MNFPTIYVGSLENLPPTAIILASDEASIGVAAIRDLTRLISLNSQVPQEVFIKSAHHLTEEAQNALLKTLEEPPSHTHITLEVPNEDLLLPTIQSRCEIIYGPRKTSIKTSTIPSFTNLGARLSFAKTKALKRAEVLDFIDSLLQTEKTITHLQALFLAKKHLKANTHVRLVVENLFLNW